MYLLQEMRKRYFKKTFWAEEYMSVVAQVLGQREGERGGGEGRGEGKKRRGERGRKGEGSGEGKGRRREKGRGGEEDGQYLWPVHQLAHHQPGTLVVNGHCPLNPCSLEKLLGSCPRNGDGRNYNRTNQRPEWNLKAWR